MFKKTILSHTKIYLAHFIKNANASSWIYIHGGPGFNCGIIEYLIEQHHLFDLLDDNLVLYGKQLIVPTNN